MSENNVLSIFEERYNGDKDNFFTGRKQDDNIIVDDNKRVVKIKRDIRDVFLFQDRHAIFKHVTK